MFRAIESARGEPTGLFDDPYAPAFLSGPYRVAGRLLGVPGGPAVLAAGFDLFIPGVRGSAVVRTKLIDDAVVRAIGEGCRQVVLLGAGFDSRAYRLGALAAIAVFDVDQPAVHTAKRVRLAASHVPHDRVVFFVDVDFEADDLGVAVCAAGFDPGVPAVFVWEGVTYYLTEDAVDRTLGSIAEVSARGSRLVFTYMDRRIVDGGAGVPGGRRLSFAVRRIGARFSFGFETGQVGPYLERRRFDLVSDVTTAEFARRHLATVSRNDRASTWEHVVVAVRTA